MIGLIPGLVGIGYLICAGIQRISRANLSSPLFPGVLVALGVAIFALPLSPSLMGTPVQMIAPFGLLPLTIGAAMLLLQLFGLLRQEEAPLWPGVLWAIACLGFSLMIRSHSPAFVTPLYSLAAAGLLYSLAAWAKRRKSQI